MLGALVVIALLSAILVPSVIGIIDYTDRQETANRLDVLRSAMNDAYAANAMAIDDAPGAVIRFDGPQKTDGDSSHAFEAGFSVTFSEDGAAILQSGFNTLSDYAIETGTNMALDGYGNAWEIFVSQRLTGQWNGYTIPYHSVAIVSSNGATTPSGDRPQLDPGTNFNAKTGQLTLGGKDQGMVFSGYDIQREKTRQTLEQLERLSLRYREFYEFAQTSDRQGSLLRDYFSKPCRSDGYESRYDITSTVASTCGSTFAYPAVTDLDFSVRSSAATCSGSTAVSTTGLGLMTALGIDDASVLSSWGGLIGMANANESGCDGHSPRTPGLSSTVNRPPYTALLMAWMPGGNVLTASAVGTVD